MINIYYIPFQGMWSFHVIEEAVSLSCDTITCRGLSKTYMYSIPPNAGCDRHHCVSVLHNHTCQPPLVLRLIIDLVGKSLLILHGGK